MKKIILFTLVLLMNFATFAQKEEKVLEALHKPITISVKETSIKINKENHPVFTTYIAADAKDVSKNWKKYFEEKFSIEFEKEKGFYKALNVKIPSLTQETVNLIGRIEEDENGARLDMALDFGTKFLSEKDEPEVAAKFKNMITTFVNEYYVGWFDQVLSKERKKVAKAEKELEKAIKTDENLTKDIEGKEKDAAKAEENIVKSEKEIADLKAKIENLKADITKYKAEKEALISEKEKQKEVIEAKRKAVEEMQKQLESLKANADKIKAGK